MKLLALLTAFVWIAVGIRFTYWSPVDQVAPPPDQLTIKQLRLERWFE